MSTKSDAIDETHDAALRSWVESANAAETDFPIQNLPLGSFRRAGSPEEFRGGIAIGDSVLDLSSPALTAVLDEVSRGAVRLAAQPSLNALMTAGRPTHRTVRRALSRVLRHDFDGRHGLTDALVPIEEAELRLPARISDFSDFYCSIYHARNVGRQFRPDNPILPNYQWLPVGYHGRTSSIGISGDTVVRPRGQVVETVGADPIFAPCRRLDYEAEVGIFVGTPNRLGRPIPIAEVEDHLFGMCILNDWSARDIQAWEYQPLGPFLAKSFATTLSPWIVGFDALEPFRKPHARPDGDPTPLPHLTTASDAVRGAIDVRVDVRLETAATRAAGLAPVRLSSSTYADSYWSLAQVVAHHTSNGCNLSAGDLIGSGTLSGPQETSRACLLELSEGGRRPIRLPTGETRVFLEDGDTVVMTARCEAEGRASIGFGECRATIGAAA